MEINEITDILKGVIHPEHNKNIVELDMIESVDISDNEIKLTIALKKARDPFANKIKRAAIDLIGNKFPDLKNNVIVLMKEPAPKKVVQQKSEGLNKNNNIRNIIAISSCKGGVGKSTVTANLATTLSQSGYSVGIMDADIYGPSMPKMFGVESHMPQSTGEGDDSFIIPAERYGVKIQSIGFFIKPNDALIWRGPMATNTLKQLIHQTQWGELDYLLIDLPPGTGDIHLTIIAETKIDGAIIVSTPQDLAIADVVRGIEMFRSKHVNIGILGLVENMSWFSPAELPENKYYIFGKDGCKNLAQEMELPLLAQIPVIASANQDNSKAAIDVLENQTVYKYYHDMSQRIIEQLAKQKKTKSEETKEQE